MERLTPIPNHPKGYSLMSDNFGYLEGETCGRDGCEGIIQERVVENCSCHISPPCSTCTTPREYCPECDWDAEEEDRSFYFNGFRCTAVSKDDAGKGMWSDTPLQKFEPRPLDPTKIDYRIKSHTNSSQICEGVYPEGTTAEEVRKLVDGTFGGRFEHFGNGKFKYIAYTD